MGSGGRVDTGCSNCCGCCLPTTPTPPTITRKAHPPGQLNWKVFLKTLFKFLQKWKEYLMTSLTFNNHQIWGHLMFTSWVLQFLPHKISISPTGFLSTWSSSLFPTCTPAFHTLFTFLSILKDQPRCHLFQEPFQNRTMKLLKPMCLEYPRADHIRPPMISPSRFSLPHLLGPDFILCSLLDVQSLPRCSLCQNNS